jgi:hypothetical protein
MLDKKRWKDLKGASAYDVNKSVLVSTTDVRKSNSAAMYLALTTYAFNGGDIVTDRDTAQKSAKAWRACSSARATRKTTSTATLTTMSPSALAKPLA